MGTRVVNIRKEKYDVYIGRAGHGLDGYFGNPVRVGAECPVCGTIHRTGLETLTCFGAYASVRAHNDPEYRARVKALYGKTLGCFCKPNPCHGDVLAGMAEEFMEDDGELPFGEQR